jgi:transcriptional regulator with XRE-family HTH domain
MAEEQTKTIAQRLKKIRKHLGYTQEELASLLKKEQSHLSRIERGMNAITIDMMQILHQLNRQINLTWLITGYGDMLLGGEVSEPRVPYGASVDSRLRDLELRVSELEKALKRLGG